MSTKFLAKDGEIKENSVPKKVRVTVASGEHYTARYGPNLVCCSQFAWIFDENRSQKKLMSTKFLAKDGEIKENSSFL